MIKKPVCEICKEAEHKYRCPQCKLIYCSLDCYKTHKDDCCKTEEKEYNVIDLTDTPDTVREFTLNEDESEDRVSSEQLQVLGDSEELKEILTNPHLRRMMTSLVNSGNPSAQLEKAMQEPIFTEFADTCLSVIDNKVNKS